MENFLKEAGINEDAAKEVATILERYDFTLKSFSALNMNKNQCLSRFNSIGIKALENVKLTHHLFKISVTEM